MSTGFGGLIREFGYNWEPLGDIECLVTIKWKTKIVLCSGRAWDEDSSKLCIFWGY